MSWLLRLHWAAIFGQAVVIFVVEEALQVALPLTTLIEIMGLEVVTNAACELWVRRARPVTEPMVAATMALHVTCFTALLYFTGGPMNPFSFLYLVHISLAALILRPRWTWTLVLFSLASSAALFIRHVPLPMDHGPHAHHMHHDGSMDMHLRGMWVAFAVGAGFIVYFLYRVTSALAGREAELVRMREHAARSERLASMATLAAGAAHELSTPLATIAVIARELERQLGPGPVSDDARAIRERVERCREIIAQLSNDAGQSPGEGAARVTSEEILQSALSGLGDPGRVRVDADGESSVRRLEVPMRTTAQALRNVVKNALDASPGDSIVVMRMRSEGNAVRFECEDEGSGMPADVVARCTEPFFTTKEPGSGMGLGLFLTRSVVDQLGGTLSVKSEPGVGTTVVVSLPFQGAANGRVAEARAS